MSLKVFLIRLSTFLGGLYFVLYFLTPQSVLTSIGVQGAHEYITTGFILVGAAALGIGIINITYIHLRNILRMKQGWSYSVALLLGLATMLTLAAIDWSSDLRAAKQTHSWQTLTQFTDVIKADYAAGRTDVPPLTTRMTALNQAVMREINLSGVHDVQAVVDLKLLAETNPQGVESLDQYKEKLIATSQVIQTNSQSIKEQSLATKLFELLNKGLFVALGSAIFSLLGVYIASAAYRAFRVKSVESSVMMIAALIVMLGQIPFGLWIYGELPAWRLWLLSWPNSAAFRAITLGALVAGLVLSIRMWLSLGNDGGENV